MQCQTVGTWQSVLRLGINSQNIIEQIAKKKELAINN